MTWDYVFRHVEDVVSDQSDIPEAEDRYVFGVDWAHGTEYMCVIVLKDQSVVAVMRIQSFGWKAQRDLLLTLGGFWSPDSIWISAGGPNIEALQSEGLPIISYSVTRLAKERLIWGLASAIDQRKLTVLNSVTLRDQLLNYRVELLSSGLCRYYALPEIGGDCVISLALAWHGVNYGGTGISFV